MSTNGKIMDEVAAWTANQRVGLEEALSRLESPIEQLFVLAMLNDSGWDFAGDHRAPRWDEEVWSTPGADLSLLLQPPRRHIFLESFYGPNASEKAVVQLPIHLGPSTARIDIAMWLGGTATRVAVELDGHDFHEKTKEQARKEKSRQRLLTAAGWHVLRFTGSEVYADAEKCVAEALGLVDAMRSRR